MPGWDLIVVATVTGGCALAGSAIGPLLTQRYNVRENKAADSGRKRAELRRECTAAMEFVTGYIASLCTATRSRYMPVPEYTFESGSRQLERLAVTLEKTVGLSIYPLVREEMKLMQRAEALGAELSRADAQYWAGRIEQLQQPNLTADEMRAILSEPTGTRMPEPALQLQNDFRRNHVQMHIQMDELGWRV